jgi:3,4-dihydroxy 2-butanone 4-phosphate synthase/GTP cyclohydrolase II
VTHEAGSIAFSEGRGCLSTVPEILEDMRNGRMVVLVDAEDRENEGDLVVPAQMATPDVINFMAMHGRGLICLSLSQARANELRLESMVRRNASRNRPSRSRRAKVYLPEFLPTTVLAQLRPP